MHFTEIICCNTEIRNVISVFDNRIVSAFLLRRVSQPPIALGCEDTIRFLNKIRTFSISVLQQIISVKCTTAMHTGRRCPFKVQSGNSSISSENLFKPSQRKSWYGTILANICRLVGVEVVENSKVYSDHVCMQSLRPKNPESRITV